MKYIIIFCILLTACLAFAEESEIFYRNKQDGVVLHADKKAVDVKTFKILNDIYAVDKGNVYKYVKNSMYIGYVLLEKYDPVDFSKAFKSMNEQEFSRYLQYIIIDGVDKESFVLLSPENGWYAKDKNRIYFQGKPLDDADYASFILLSPSYAKDNSHVWRDGRVLIDADPDSFQYFNYTYAKDKAQVYCYGQILTDADVSTFRSEREKTRCGADKNGLYFDCQRVWPGDKRHDLCVSGSK